MNFKQLIESALQYKTIKIKNGFLDITGFVTSADFNVDRDAEALIRLTLSDGRCYTLLADTEFELIEVTSNV